MFLLTVLVLGAKNLQKLPNRYRHLRLSFATYNSAWSKVSDVSEPLRKSWLTNQHQKLFTYRNDSSLRHATFRNDLEAWRNSWEIQ